MIYETKSILVDFTFDGKLAFILDLLVAGTTLVSSFADGLTRCDRDLTRVTRTILDAAPFYFKIIK